VSFSEIAEPESVPLNLIGKTAYQASIGWDGQPSRAIDGNTAGDYN